MGEEPVARMNASAPSRSVPLAVVTSTSFGETILAEPPIHRATAIEIYEIDPELLAAFVRLLDRRMNLDIDISDRQIYLTIGEQSLNGAVLRHALA